eukprot:scaffold72585_cov56-Phaeocystis_antarctica.AAC.2
MGRAPPAGRGGWRCDRRRYRGGGHGAASRTTGVPSRPAAARCAPPARPGAVCCAPRVASLVLPPASWRVPSLHSCDAGCGPDDEVGQSDGDQRELAGEAQAMRAVNQKHYQGLERDHVRTLEERRACGSRSYHEENYVNGDAQRCQNCPSPGAHPLTSHRVVPAGAVEQHAAYEPRDGNTEHECGPKRPHAWLHELIPGEVSEDESHQEDMRKIGHAEELRCEG